MSEKTKRTRRSREQIESDKRIEELAKQAKSVDKEEVYDHAMIRKEARDRVPGALDVLDKVMNFEAFEYRVKEFYLKRILEILSKHNVDHFAIREVEALDAVLLLPCKEGPTIAQMLKAAELVLDRAGDRPAVAAPADDAKVYDYLEMNPGFLPQIPQ